MATAQTRTITAGRGTMNATGTSPEPCPACGQRDVLIALGIRYDRPYRWRPWIIRDTHLSLCAGCDALVERAEGFAPPPPGIVPAPVSRLAYGPA